MPLRVVIAGGGTAGHVYPGLALAHELRERGHAVEFAGTARGLEARLVPAAGFPFHAVPAAPLVRKVSPAALRAPAVALRALRRCRAVVRGADAVIGMGGYVSVPAVLAARTERLPVVLHEQNAVPGLANRVLSRTARTVAVAFPGATSRFPRRATTVVTGNPVRAEILRVPEERDVLAKEALDVLELEGGRRTVVIFGGSQGALHLDRSAVGACYLLRDRSDLQVVLITGPLHLPAVQRALPQERGGLIVRLFGYLERMDLAYARADLVVSRAGATTIAETTVSGLPSLLVPYPFATGNHQEANAREVQRVGAASVILDEQLSSVALAERLRGLIDHPERLELMARSAAAFGRPDAAQRLADVVEDAAGGGST